VWLKGGEMGIKGGGAFYENESFFFFVRDLLEEQSFDEFFVKERGLLVFYSLL